MWSPGAESGEEHGHQSSGWVQEVPWPSAEDPWLNHCRKGLIYWHWIHVPTPGRSHCDSGHMPKFNGLYLYYIMIFPAEMSILVLLTYLPEGFLLLIESILHEMFNQINPYDFSMVFQWLNHSKITILAVSIPHVAIHWLPRDSHRLSGCRRMIGSPGQMGWFRLRTLRSSTWSVNGDRRWCLMIY